MTPRGDIHLRPASDLDAGALGDMITQAVCDHDWKPVLHSAAQDIAHAATLIRRGWVTVATEARAPHIPLGFLAREDTDIHALFITRTARRHGYGTCLLQAAKSSVDDLRLWTFQANHAARHFYEKHGFTEIARTSGDNDEALPDIRYHWRAGDTKDRA